AVLDQLFLYDGLDGHRSCRYSQRIAAIARRAATGIGPRLAERDRLADHDATHREAAAESFPHEQDVGDNAVVLDAEHRARAPEPRDHLVADEQRADLGR